MRVSLMSMLSITALVVGALHGKLSHDANLAASLDDEPKITRPDAGGADPTHPGGTETDGPGAAAGTIKADYEDISSDLARAETLLEPETFAEAEGLLKELLERNAAPSSLGKARTLLGEVRLLRALTIIIPRHGFANGEDLEVVTLADGKEHLARVKEAGKEEIRVKLQDGRSLRMRKARLRGRRKLDPAMFQKRLERELGLRTEALGAEANPVEIYRTVVTWCLEFGLAKSAIKHLRAALRKPSAGVLVDLFCEGDVQVHRRTQAALAGIDQVAMLDRHRSFSRIRRAARTPGSTTDGSEDTGGDTGGGADKRDDPGQDKRPTSGDPNGDTDRRPTTGGPGDSGSEPDPGTSEEPDPIPDDAPKPRIDRTAELQKEAKWVKADKLYQQGIRLYRTSFSGSSQENFETVKRSRHFFEQALRHLIELSETPKWEDDGTLEQRAVEIQQLIYDCIKRGKV